MTFEKILVVLVLAAVIVGPHRLPLLAQRLAALVRSVRAVTDAARTHVEREVGVPLAVDEWRALDPRQYDPRRIVREALTEPDADSLVAAPVVAEPAAQPYRSPTGISAETVSPSGASGHAHAGS